jgi:hypothetical protein
MSFLVVRVIIVIVLEAPPTVFGSKTFFVADLADNIYPGSGPTASSPTPTPPS